MTCNISLIDFLPHGHRGSVIVIGALLSPGVPYLVFIVFKYGRLYSYLVAILSFDYQGYILSLCIVNHLVDL